MLKLKNKLKRKFRSSKIDNSRQVGDFDALSFDSPEVTPASSPPQSDTLTSGCQDTGTSGSSRNSSSLNYSCCYNYNFHINYNVQRRQPHGNETDRSKWADQDDPDGAFFDSNSNLVSENSSVEAAKKVYSQRARPMSTERSKRSTSSMSAKVSPAGSQLVRGRKKAARCLSTSDLSTYGAQGAPDFQTICNRLHSVTLSGAPVPNQAQLTDHDRRILHCMILKRIKEIERLEDSVLAKQCWEQEKTFRKSLIDQQEKNYRKAIRQKRNIEKLENRNRRQRLERLEQQQIEKIQNEICEKDIRAASLRKNIEIQKGIRECEKRSRELKRMEDVTVNHEEKVLDKDIWRQSLEETLEERASRANELRRRVVDVYRRRLKIDNQLEQKMHAHNLKQTLEQERYKLGMLKERITARESKFQKFKDGKKRIFDQLMSRAKTTAALRDMVKLSIGPETRGKPSRCGSSNSQQRVVDMTGMK